MRFSVFSALFTVFILSSCATQETACEDVTLASEQIQECQLLQRKITQAKGQPLIRTELERRYQQDCIDIRYYRDDHQSAICGNKKSMDKLNKSIVEVKKQ
ncbi:hypothetical protein AADZ91_05950 [Colwelliaceae bacterium 6441]